MKWIDKLERKYGKYGIPNLTMYIVICYVVGYLLMMVNPAVLSMLSLDISKVLRGQIWRLVTWVIYPPTSSSLLWFVVAIMFFYYPIGTMLERTWGAFQYTLYIFSGLLFTVIAAFLLHFITGGYVVLGGMTFALGGSIYSTYYISMSIFLALAATYPNLQVMLMFVIPVKMSWMAILYAVMIVYDIFKYIGNGQWFMAVPIIASLLNFLIYFLSMRNLQRYDPREIRRKQQFKKAVAGSRVDPRTGGISKHKCAICGRTELDDPNLEFRFCSRCNGNYEYCQDHLFTHEHVK